MSGADEEYVHMTARQRLRALRKEEGRRLYERALQKLEAKETPRARCDSALNGVPVNHCGQTLDGTVPAITRLVRGDFYLAQGAALGETHARPLGRHHRFHDPEASPAEAKTAGTNGMSSHAHSGQSRHHHCHHGHRGTSGGGGDDAGHREPVLSKEPLPSAPPPPPPPRYLTQGTAQSRNRQRPPATCEQPMAAVEARSQARFRPAADPYESALHAVRAHEPGAAACISEKELEVIRKAATRPLTPAHTAQRPSSGKRQDQKQIFF